MSNKNHNFHLPSPIKKILKCHYTLGGFKNPIFLKYLTINGVAPSVILIRTGANSLCTAYAATKVPVFAASLLDASLS